MRRVSVPELLDSDAGSESELREAFADLKRVNRWLGGTSATLTMLDRVMDHAPGRELSVLEVASGMADTPRAAVERAGRRNIVLRATCLDRSLSHLQNGAPSVVGDALHLPFADESFDVVSCGLFAHHLEPAAMVRFAQEALRVARTALLINDLARSYLHLAMVWIARPLWRSRITRHDSVASVWRSYTGDELRALLQQAGPERVDIERYYFFRVGAIAWKKPSS